MNKKQLQSEQTKKKITECAHALFINKGYKATSIEDIVTAAECSKGNLYHHFKNKESLFLYLLNEWDRNWNTAWQEKARNYKTIEEILYGLAEFQAIDDFSNPLVKAWDEFMSIEKEKSEVKEHLQQMMANYLRFNERIFAGAMERNEIKQWDADMLSLIFDSLIRGLGMNARNMSLKETLAMNRVAIQMLLHGIK